MRLGYRHACTRLAARLLQTWALTHPVPSQHTLPWSCNEASSASAPSRVRSTCIRFFAMEPPGGEGRWEGHTANTASSETGQFMRSLGLQSSTECCTSARLLHLG